LVCVHGNLDTVFYKMKKSLIWIGLIVVVILAGYLVTIFLNWSSLPWSPAYKTVTPYVPPPGEQLPTATYFSPSLATVTIEPDLLWIDPALPDLLRTQLNLPVSMEITDHLDQATATITIANENPITHWVYVLSAPFPTVPDGISSSELRAAWEGGKNPISGSQPLLMTEEVQVVLSIYWGEPAAGAVEVLPGDKISEKAWSSRPSLAILPFEDLSPDWKVMKLDGISPLQKDFIPEEYMLAVPISHSGVALDDLQKITSNRDPEKLTTVVMTGVTALVRATAWTMEDKGINYPAQDIKDWLKNADITHISNEVPFASGCPYPNPSQKGLRFCSDPRYIKLMEFIGTDVVELTGDHFGDYGPEAMLYTLELYQQREWPYYGGGANRHEAQEPVLLEHNGNKIAFLGCNAKGGGYATAAAGYPGAVACDFNKMTEQIKSLREEGYLPIATFQHFEYYTYAAQPDQIRDAKKLTQAGAVIVSGSQAHQPQGFEIKTNAFVHHGLGNLFFDQIYEIPPNTATAFIDRHVFYNGQHISTELLTIKFVDYARARPMTASERKDLLRTVFKASGW
jgi:poly-gamma-glutamate synthesis protein (capsule biosynthesis protein)